MKNVLIIKSALVTEKNASLAALGKYVFLVERSATKNDVKEAIREIYKADVVAVDIVSLPAKRKRFRGKIGRTTRYKKAIVTVKKGQKIDIE